MMMIPWTSAENHLFLNPQFPQDQAQHLQGLIPEVASPLQGHLFLLTSGTTAQSIQDLKWVALSKTAFLASAEAVNRHLESKSSDIWLHPLPDFHVGGLGIWARSFLNGARVVKFQSWNPKDFVHALQESGATLTALVPTQIYDLVKENFHSPPSLRAVLVGGGALSTAIYQKARSLDWPLLPTYGMTETCSQIATASMDSLSHQKINLDGKISELAIPSLEVLGHLEVQEAYDGKLQIKGSSLLSGYIYENEGRPRFVDPKKDGWFYSQDRGVLKNRQLQILGRIDDFVKIGGESVDVSRLRGIFDEIRSHYQLLGDLAILPVPDDRLGQAIHLIYDSQISEPDCIHLVEKFNSKVLGFERIRKTHQMDTIPRTALGKLISSACLEKVATSPSF